MTDEEKPPFEKDEKDEKDEQAHGSYRKHGYQGYPNNPTGGGVHTGTGFAGVSTPGTGDVGLPQSGVISERTKQDAEDEAEDTADQK